jgi:hypothetical protein
MAMNDRLSIPSTLKVLTLALSKSNYLRLFRSLDKSINIYDNNSSKICFMVTVMKHIYKYNKY